jgi:TolB-like protein/DNA-binding winged helix-turn-helix (wHTH) protein/tetratricopeptide (TPR) repeat protein
VRGRVVRFGAFEVNFETRELQKGGSKLRLQEQPCRILELLIQRGGDVLTREELRQTLWPDGTFVDFDHGLHTAINRLRETLGDSAAQARFIETIPRRGYRFIAATEIIEGAPAEYRSDTGKSRPASAPAGSAGPQLTSVPRAGTAVPANTAERNRSRRKIVCKRIIAAAVLTLFVAAAGYFRLRRSNPITAIAVLPFANVAADSELEFLSDGLTENLIDNLSRLPGLHVLAPSTVARYKDRKTDPAIAGRQLRVGAVVAGDVLRHNDRLLVRVHLIRASDSSQIWGERYERPISEGLAIHDEIASHIANRLGSRLTADETREVVSHGTSNNKAFELYMRGMHHLSKRNEQAIRTALAYFVQATETDPMYALAFSAIGTCYALLPMYAAVTPEWACTRAKTAALKGVELDGRIAEPHAVLGLVLRDFYWDWAGAEEEFRTAINLNPNYLNARVWYAETIALTRSPEAGLSEFQKAQQLEPASLLANTQLAYGLFMLRRYDEAIEQLKKTLELDPAFIVTHLRLMHAYIKKQMFEEATAAAQRFCALSRDKRDVEYLAVVYAVSGRVDEARQLLRNLHEIAAHVYVSPESFAEVYLALGDRIEALRMLERGVETKASDIIGLRDPIWDSLRSEPRFRALLKKMNLPL